MRRRPFLALTVCLLVLAACERAPRPVTPSAADLAEALRRAVVAGLGRTAASPPVAGLLRERDSLAAFYSRRAYRPAWLREGGVDPALAGELLEAVRGADHHGLRPTDYHADELELRLEERPSHPERLAALDLLLSDAYLHLGRRLAVGVVDPAAFQPGQAADRPIPHTISALERALRDRDVASSLARLAPSHPEYAALVSAMGRLLDARAGDWPRVPAGAPLEPGARDPRVVALRARLAWPAKPLRLGDGDPTRLDAPLAQALRDFQRRHALASDGILGERTLEALNVGLERRKGQLRANLERWRWMPRELGRRHLRVNTAAFSLEAFEDGQPSLDMRVVVGCIGWETPMLHTAITHLVLNPAWEVPKSIAVKEILPAAQRDPGYFAAHDIRVLAPGPRGSRSEVDPATVDWDKMSDARFPFHLRQPPGPRNPLGRIKFASPNRFAVYLHGTPNRSAFEQVSRALSHGCVRVEDEVTLALYALEPSGGWTRERLQDALETEMEFRIPLAETLPLHLIYLTAAADAAGTPFFREDPYGWDAPLIAALEAPPPGVAP